MRVLLSTYGSRGDVEPVAGLAVQLRELGVEVLMSAPPDDEFADLLAGVGVPLVPVGPSARELSKSAPPPTSIPERAAQIIAAQTEAILPVAKDCDAMVVTGMMPAAAGARSVAEKVGIPSVFAALQKVILPSPHHTPLAYPGRPFPPEITDNRQLWELDAESINALFGDALNTNRVTMDLPPVEHVRDYVFGDRPWLATDPTLDPWSGDLGVVQTGAWLLPDTRPLPPELMAFLDAGTPPVFVGFGSMVMHSSPDAATTAIEAVRAQGRRVVVRAGWADLSLIDDQDDCFAVGEINQQALFPRVAAVVHHGGSGTTTTATRAGTPQVVVPQLADQPYFAGRVAELGVGVAHDGPTPTFESLSTALKSALTPETRARATAVAGQIRTNGTTIAAQLLVTNLA